MAAIRNIGIMAHIDAGKTTTTERILYYTGKSHRMGEVDDGSATMDWMQQEQDRGITITSAATTCYWRDLQINLIDTPGHVDFTAEVERALRVLDGVVAIFDAVGGVEPQSETVWRQADRYAVPRIAYINKMDRVGADFFAAIEQMKSKLHAKPLVLNIPVGREQGFTGVIDLLAMRCLEWDGDSLGAKIRVVPIPEYLRDEAERQREVLVDWVASHDDALIERYLADDTISNEELMAVIRRETIAQRVTPVLCGASLRNIGVQPLLDTVVDYLPAPDELPPIKAHHASRAGKERMLSVERRRDGPPSGLVFKIQHDREAGAICFVRVYSGVIKSGSPIYNINKRLRERAHRIIRMHANHSERIERLGAGDIGAIVGFKQAQTGDSIGSEGFPVLLERMRFPEPVISVAIEPDTLSQNEKLKTTLGMLSKEDPTFTWHEDEDTGQLIISGMGELHLDVIVRRIIDDYGIAARVGNPQVGYREAIEERVRHTERFRRVIANRENCAELTITVAPRDRGAGNFIDASVDRLLPPEIAAAVRRGLEAAISSGILFGYPVVDIEIIVEGAVYDQNSSTDFAFEAAANQGFDSACRAANPQLLEPIMRVDISCPKQSLGEVIGSLTQRGGIIQSVESHLSNESIRAYSPLRFMFGYTTVLRNTTQGGGSFLMEFSHFAPKRRSRRDDG